MSDPGSQRPRAMPSPFSAGPRAQPPIRTRPTRTPPPRDMPSNPGSNGSENTPQGSAAPRAPFTPIAPPSFGFSTPQGLATPTLQAAFPGGADGVDDVAKPRVKQEPVEEMPQAPSPAVPAAEQAPRMPESAPPQAAAEQSDTVRTLQPPPSVSPSLHFRSGPQQIPPLPSGIGASVGRRGARRSAASSAASAG